VPSSRAAAGISPNQLFAHQPDHQPPARRHSRIHDRMLEIGHLARLVLEREIDRRVLLRPRIDLARALRQVHARSAALREGTRGHARQNNADHQQ
jgi:hypothetical protein